MYLSASVEGRGLSVDFREGVESGTEAAGSSAQLYQCNYTELMEVFYGNGIHVPWSGFPSPRYGR